eukprot:1159144-Pelagomonas_calceolata.AAC.3
MIQVSLDGNHCKTGAPSRKPIENTMQRCMYLIMVSNRLRSHVYPCLCQHIYAGKEVAMLAAGIWL